MRTSKRYIKCSATFGAEVSTASAPAQKIHTFENYFLTMIYSVAVALAVAATASANLYVSDPTHQKFMWESFKQEHNRAYSTMEEETQRFGFFLENLKVADLRNEKERKNGGTAIHGITKFSDLSQAEFESRYLTADLRMKTKREDTGMTGNKPVKADAGLVDWTGIYTTPVKDQVRFLNFLSRLYISPLIFLH